MPAIHLPTYDPQRLLRLRQVEGWGRGYVYEAVIRLALNGRPLFAEALCRAARFVLPRQRRVLACIAILAAARGDSESAARLCERCVRQAPWDTLSRWLFALTAWDDRDPERTLAILGDEDLERDSGPILALRTRAYIARGEYSRAANTARSACARFPKAAWAHAALIRCLARDNRLEDALDAAAHAVQCFPENRVFYRLASSIGRRLGRLDEARRMELRGLEAFPGDSLLMRMLLQSSEMAPELDGESVKRMRAYEAAGRKEPVDFRVLRQIAKQLGSEVDPMAVQQVADSEQVDGDPLSILLAQSFLDDLKKAALTLGKILQSGSTDQRLIAFVSIYGEQLAPYLSGAGLPGLEFLLRKLKARAGGARFRREDAVRAVGVAEMFEEPGPATEGVEPPSVSFLCPIHRPRDVGNLLTQVNRQQWGRAQVVVCISSAEIDLEAFSLGLRPDLDRQIFRCEPGKNVGYYLNRCVERSNGSFLLRLDADDAYAPQYTRYMLSFVHRTSADIISMDLTSYYFADIDQTYHVRSPTAIAAGSPLEAVEDRFGSGSTLCARARLFEQIRFSEELPCGEDLAFYRKARECGFKVGLVPGYFHTAARHGEQGAHTWQADDFNLLTDTARYIGDGCIVPEPGVAADLHEIPDPFTQLFAHESLEWIRELRLDEILRNHPWPVRLIVGEKTAVPVTNDALLEVSRNPPSATAEGAPAWLFLPEQPETEYTLSRRLGCTSVIYDVMPQLVCERHDDIYRSGIVSSGVVARQRKRFLEATQRYVILCNPRSGSEHLCSLLASVGLGNPSELVREPVAHLLCHDVSIDQYLPRILGWGARGGIVGTKIVTQYLFSNFDEARLGDFIGWLQRKSFKVVVLSRSEVDSAFSAWVAAQTGSWHARERPGATGADERSPAAGLPSYDFDEIAAFLEQHEAWSTQLQRLLAGAVDEARIRRVSYDELVRAPAGVVGKVAQLLGAELLPGAVPVSRAIPGHKSTDNLRELRARFGFDLEARGMSRS